MTSGSFRLHSRLMRLFPPPADANARRLVLARGLRALADGYVSILLPAYLLALGLDSFADPWSPRVEPRRPLEVSRVMVSGNHLNIRRLHGLRPLGMNPCLRKNTGTRRRAALASDRRP